MKIKIYITIFLVSILVCASCGGNKGKKEPKSSIPPTEVRMKGDSTIYGYACEGCTDSVLVFLPSDGSDPVKYDIIEAFRNRKVLGSPKIGDWVAVVPNKDDKMKADLVVDLDELKGIWCYVVMPKMRNADQMSQRVQDKIMKNMPDSVKETYIIPREYGFALKRQWVAESVGYVRQNSSVEDESPVVYPRLAYFVEWRIWNGKLIITSGKPKITADNVNGVTDKHLDTCDIIYLRSDSLILSSDGISRGYYRKSNVNELNKKARQVAAELERKARKETEN